MYKIYYIATGHEGQIHKYKRKDPKRANSCVLSSFHRLLAGCLRFIVFLRAVFVSSSSCVLSLFHHLLARYSNLIITNRRRHRKENCQGLDGAPSHRQAHRPEPSGEGVARNGEGDPRNLCSILVAQLMERIRRICSRRLLMGMLRFLSRGLRITVKLTVQNRQAKELQGTVKEILGTCAPD